VQPITNDHTNWPHTWLALTVNAKTVILIDTAAQPHIPGAESIIFCSCLSARFITYAHRFAWHLICYIKGHKYVM
jgi:hypothetical protein